jgi:hypothetical protein
VTRARPGSWPVLAARAVMAELARPPVGGLGARGDLAWRPPWWPAPAPADASLLARRAARHARVRLVALILAGGLLGALLAATVAAFTCYGSYAQPRTCGSPEAVAATNTANYSRVVAILLLAVIAAAVAGWRPRLTGYAVASAAVGTVYAFATLSGDNEAPCAVPVIALYLVAAWPVLRARSRVDEPRENCTP